MRVVITASSSILQSPVLPLSLAPAVGVYPAHSARTHIAVYQQIVQAERARTALALLDDEAGLASFLSCRNEPHHLCTGSMHA